MQQKGSVLGGLIFGVIFSAVGFGVAFFVGKPILDNAKASSTWPSVSGVITNSQVSTSKNDDNQTMYSADISYGYSVANEKYVGSTVYFGDNYSSSSSSGANETVHRYPVKKEVKVFYNPEEIGASVLEPGTTWSSYMLFGFGLIFLVVGVLVLLTSAASLLGGGLVIVGAITGLIGGRKKSGSESFSPPASRGNESPYPENENIADSSTDASKWSLDDKEDDGFDI